MKPLGDSYSKNKFHYELICRENDVAIFKQRLRPGAGCLAYEVIIVQQAKEYIIQGAVIPAHEYAPGNEAFGTLGWSFPTLDRAKAKMKEVLNKIEEEKTKVKK